MTPEYCDSGKLQATRSDSNWMSSGHTTFTRVLVVEDDPDLRRLLRAGLEEEGFLVEAASNGHEAIRAADDAVPDLLVVDIGLPDTDGRDLCQALRSRGVNSPVIFLTALDAVSDRLSGFSAGGDDYLTKPFALAELTARLRALDRRSGMERAATCGELRLDPVTHALTVAEKEAPLTPTEFRVLGSLVEHAGDAVRRRDLVRAGWPEGAIVHDNTLDVYIARLRKKLGELSADTQIVTVHRVGYRLK
jgi:two-component system OmpR family response regulator